VPRTANIATRARLPLTIAVVVCALARAARADGDRLVLGSHDPALTSALSVAVSPRGLSVVELPEPLARAADVTDARREAAVHDAVGVVWLCDDDAGAHALCFCDRAGRLSVRPISVTSPLAPPDAAALALSVKMMLGPPPPPAAPHPVVAPAIVPKPPLAPVADVEAHAALPALAVEVGVGARGASHTAPRFGLEGVLALEPLGRALGFGLGMTAGPSFDAGYGRALDDLTFSFVARGQRGVGPFVLQLDLGSSAHLISADAGAAERRTELSLDARAGAVWLFGRYVVGLRAGGLYVPAAETYALPIAADAILPLTLPRWNVEVLLTFGLAFPAPSTD
jgi:hypothetical protein